jgi:hypothetical protein
VQAHTHNLPILQSLVQMHAISDWSGWSARIDATAVSDGELTVFERALNSLSLGQMEIRTRLCSRFTGNLPESLLLPQKYNDDSRSQLFVRTIVGYHLDPRLSTAEKQDKRKTNKRKKGVLPDDLKMDAKDQTVEAVPKDELKATKCKCFDLASSHVQAFGPLQQEKEMWHRPDEAADREWNAHTEEYKNQYNAAADELSSGYEDVEKELERWSRENHNKYCCLHRHKNLGYVH